MTKTLLNDERYYFEAFMKTVQYLATLTTQKGIMKNLEKLIKKFYNSDFFAFYECGADGTIIEHLNKFSHTLFSKNGLEKIEETIVQVQESGFFASELINSPDPYAMVFLPISKANQIISVIVIGHKYSERLPKYLLNIYLALGGLIGTTIEKLTLIQELRTQHQKLKKSEDELMKHRDHLEKLVEIRMEELKESEERYRELANSLPQVITETDKRGNLTFVNANAYSVFGYTLDDFNKGLNVLQMIIPEDRKKAMKDIMRFLKLKGKEEEIKRKKIGYTMLRKDGSTFPSMVYSSPIIYNDTSVGLRSIIIDITDRKKAEKELTNALEEIKRSNTKLEQFAYIASHDLQQPLTMISGFASLLKIRYKESLDKDAREFIDFIIDGATRMHDLIKNLLSFSRIGTQGKTFKPTNMNVVLKKTLNNVRISAIETKAIITNDPLPVIIADESQMGQLLQNLISNAIKFHGPVQPKIHISGETKKNEWIFAVRDNGIGIDSKNFERIFVIFQRLFKKGEFPGTGIGLAVCKKIIQLHGGKLWVESELKKGSTFYFSIPRNQNGVS